MRMILIVAIAVGLRENYERFFHRGRASLLFEASSAFLRFLNLSGGIDRKLFSRMIG